MLPQFWRFFKSLFQASLPASGGCRQSLELLGLAISLRSLSHVQLFATLWTISRQAPLSMGFFRQEYWSELSFPPRRDLPNPGPATGLRTQATETLSKPKAAAASRPGPPSRRPGTTRTRRRPHLSGRSARPPSSARPSERRSAKEKCGKLGSGCPALSWVRALARRGLGHPTRCQGKAPTPHSP